MLELHANKFYLVSALGDLPLLSGTLSCFPPHWQCSSTPCQFTFPWHRQSGLGLMLNMVPRPTLGAFLYPGCVPPPCSQLPFSQCWGSGGGVLTRAQLVTPHPNFGPPRAASSTSCICLWIGHTSSSPKSSLRLVRS